MAVTAGRCVEGKGDAAVGDGGMDRPVRKAGVLGIPVTVTVDIQPFGTADGTRRFCRNRQRHRLVAERFELDMARRTADIARTIGVIGVRAAILVTAPGYRQRIGRQGGVQVGPPEQGPRKMQLEVDDDRIGFIESGIDQVVLSDHNRPAVNGVIVRITGQDIVDLWIKFKAGDRFQQRETAPHVFSFQVVLRRFQFLSRANAGVWISLAVRQFNGTHLQVFDHVNETMAAIGEVVGNHQLAIVL